MKDHAVMVIRDRDKLLFVQRAATKKSLPNMWAFPSGSVEEGEEPRATVVREAREELGVDVEVESRLAVAELPELSARLHFFICRLVSSDQEMIFDPGEIQNHRWLAMAEFFAGYTDDQIGHGLVYLRKHPELWTPRLS